MAKPVSESAILVPRDPSLDERTDEWPEIVLENAFAHIPGRKKELVSVLEAAAGFPITIVGQLQPLVEDDAHLYKNKNSPITGPTLIVLDKVYTYSYGQCDDGSIVIWAAGKAGWFEIQPAKSYNETYYQMVDAIKTFWFIADAYKETRKKGKGRNASVLPPYKPTELFEKYAQEHLGTSDAESGMEQMHAHVEFLSLAMLSGKEGLFWSKFPIYGHLRNKFPDVFAEMKQRMTAHVPQRQTTRGSSKPTKQSSVGSGSSSDRGKRKRPDEHEGDAEASATEGSVENDTKHALLLAAFEDAAKPVAPSTIARSNRRKNPTSAVRQLSHVDDLEPPAKDEETDEETRLRERKNKSSLTLRATKATKGTSLKGKAPEIRTDDDSASDDSRSRIITKRKVEDVETHGRSRRRRENRSHDDEGIDIPSSPSVISDEESTTSPTGISADLGKSSFQAMQVPDPVQEDTWVCALDGCTHKVYGASRPDSQRLIREHYALHAYDDDERVQMVKRLAAPSLPAGHLMEKVRQQAKIDGFPGSRQMSSRYPNLAVRQRY